MPLKKEIGYKILTWPYGIILGELFSEKENMQINDSQLLTGQAVQAIMNVGDYEKSYSLSGPGLLGTYSNDTWLYAAGEVSNNNIYGGPREPMISGSSWIADLNIDFNKDTIESPLAGYTLLDIPTIALMMLDPSQTGRDFISLVMNNAVNSAPIYGGVFTGFSELPPLEQVKSMPTLSCLMGPGWNTFAPVPTKMNVNFGNDGISSSISWSGMTQHVHPITPRYEGLSYFPLCFQTIPFRQSSWFDTIVSIVQSNIPIENTYATGLVTSMVEQGNFNYNFEYQKPKWIGRGQQPVYILKSVSIEWSLTILHDMSYTAERQDYFYHPSLVSFFGDYTKWYVKVTGSHAGYFSTMLENVINTSIGNNNTYGIKYVGRSQGNVIYDTNVEHRRGVSKYVVQGKTLIG